MGRSTRRGSGVIAALVLGAGVGAACDDADTPAGTIDATDAFVAIVQWQAAEQEPVLGDDGEPLRPVIYVVSADGETVDVGIQATVAEAVAENAVVRFADDATDAFDPGVEGEPVRDDGTLLAVGEIGEPANALTVDVDRYTAHTDAEQLTLRIAERTDATTLPDGADPELNRAEVTDARPR